MRHGIGVFEGYVGRRIAIGEGVAGEVYQTGRPVAVDDYDAFSAKLGFVPPRTARRRRRRAAELGWPGRRRDRPRLRLDRTGRSASARSTR